MTQVVVGGGPTGVEFAAELQDFFEDDLRKWVPDISDSFHVTLVEALPNVRIPIPYAFLSAAFSRSRNTKLTRLPGSPHVLQDLDRVHREDP